MPGIMAIWVVEFSSGGYKIRKIFALEHTYSKEIIEFWELAYLGAYGTHMFAHLVWVGEGTSKTFVLFYHFENV